MPDYASFIIITLTILIFNFFFNKLNLIRDKKNTSFHKKFIESEFEPPFSGGIFLIFTIIIYLNASMIFKFFLVTIFLIGFFSDLNFFKSINLRFYLQLISIVLFIYFSDLYIQSIRIEFVDNLQYFLPHFVY